MHQVKFLHRKVKSTPTVRNVLCLMSAEKNHITEVTSVKTLYESQLVHKISFKPTTPIFKYIHKVNISKVMGIDKIPNYALKFITYAYNYLIQQSVNQSYLPTEWRIHKSGDKSSVKNYM